MYRWGIVVSLFLLSQTAFGADKPRVLIEDGDSRQMVGAGSGSGVRGSTRLKRVEIMKTFTNKYPQIIVTTRKDKADFIVFFEHEGGKSSTRRGNKVPVFNKDSDLIFANSTRSLGNSVKDTCETINGYPLISRGNATGPRRGPGFDRRDRRALA